MTTKLAAETANRLRNQGYRFNTKIQVDRELELWNIVHRLDGREHVQFVVAIDGYGNTTEWGLEDEARTFHTGQVRNADGDPVN